MAKRIFLLSGHTSTGGLRDLDRVALDAADNEQVVVLNLTFQDKDKLRKKAVFFSDYFTSLGAECVEFVEEETTKEEAKELLERSGLLYLPGGDTETLMQAIIAKNLTQLIFSFPGVISGNSAGAYVMCPHYVKIRGDNVEIIPMMAIVDFWTKAHYEPKFDPFLEKLSKGEGIIYALENNSGISVQDTELEFTGNVWKFSKGTKEKMSNA